MPFQTSSLSAASVSPLGSARLLPFAESVAAPVLARAPLYPKLPRSIASGFQGMIFRMFTPWLTFSGMRPVVIGDRGALQGRPSCHTSDTTHPNPALDTFPDVNVPD